MKVTITMHDYPNRHMGEAFSRALTKAKYEHEIKYVSDGQGPMWEVSVDKCTDNEAIEVDTLIKLAHSRAGNRALAGIKDWWMI